MKKILKFAGLAVVALVFLSFAKNAILQTVLTSTLSGVMHVPVKIGSLNVSLLSASMNIKNLEVRNPSGFKEKQMALAPQIAFDIEPGEIFRGRVHFREVRLDLRELMVVRDKNGRLNVDAVKPTERQRDEAKKEEASQGATPKLQIDKLYLSIGRVTYKDYSAGQEPAIQTFDINIQNREYANIHNPMALVSLIMFEALTRTTLSKLADLDLHAFKEGGLEALSKSLGFAGNSSEAVQATAKKLASLFQ